MYTLHRGYIIGLRQVMSRLELCLMTAKTHEDVCTLLVDAEKELNRVRQEIIADY